MRGVTNCQNPGKESCRESLKVFLKENSLSLERTYFLPVPCCFFLLLLYLYLVLRRHVKTREEACYVMMKCKGQWTKGSSIFNSENYYRLN